jgi:hypothetical protein
MTVIFHMALAAHALLAEQLRLTSGSNEGHFTRALYSQGGKFFVRIYARLAAGLMIQTVGHSMRIRYLQ